MNTYLCPFGIPQWESLFYITVLMNRDMFLIEQQNQICLRYNLHQERKLALLIYSSFKVILTSFEGEFLVSLDSTRNDLAQIKWKAGKEKQSSTI